jgi:hypothetical protein
MANTKPNIKHKDTTATIPKPILAPTASGTISEGGSVLFFLLRTIHFAIDYLPFKLPAMPSQRQ